jgi:hypothetical protein
VVGLLGRPAAAPRVRIDTGALRVAALIVTLIVVTAVASTLASQIGMERTAEHLSEHQAGVSATATAPAPEVDYAPTVGDSLPSPEDLLGKQEGASGPLSPRSEADQRP